ncbi:MAG: Asp23/Gls24 family envelope stress response protein, partial [Clostridia bacterium]|nr:Asp23/Gls24 family envelope stress response protein [Clostridia bacterium]
TTTAEGIAELLKRENLTKGIKVNTNDDSVKFELFVIIEYGVSMVAAANNVIEAVKYAVESQTGLRVESVNVRIQGIRV